MPFHFSQIERYEPMAGDVLTQISVSEPAWNKVPDCPFCCAVTTYIAHVTAVECKCRKAIGDYASHNPHVLKASMPPRQR